MIVELLAVSLLAVSLLGASLLTDPAPTTGQLTDLVVLGGLGAVHTELSRVVNRRWGAPVDRGVDLTSVWVFAGAATMTPGLAMALAAAARTYGWLRSGYPRAPLHRQVVGTAVTMVSCLVAAVVMGRVRGTLSTFDGLAGPGALALGLLVLVAGATAVGAAGRITARGAVVSTGAAILLPVAALSLGALVAVVLVANPWIVVLVLPVLVVLQRAGLVPQLEEAASVDDKTGLFNSAAWQTRAAAELGHNSRRPGAQAVLLLDLDHFKDVNDRYGHLAGDEVLVATAAAIRGEVREGDVVGRFGGEEFLVFLAGQTGGAHTAPAAVAERLRRTIAQLRVEIATANGPRTVAGLTVSVGVAVHPENVDLTALLQVADTALYAAKRGGRDRVCISDSRAAAPAAPAPGRARPSSTN